MDIKSIVETLTGLLPGVINPIGATPRRGHAFVVAVKDGYKLQTVPTVEPHQPPRRHKIDTVEDFSVFLLRHLDPKTTEIMAGKSAIVAASGQAWDRDEVTCCLTPDPTWKDWTDILGRKWSQKDLYRFLQAHKGDGEGVEHYAGLLRILEVNTSGSVKGHLDERGVYTMIASQKGQDIPVKLPPTLRISVPVYLGSQDRYDLDVDIEIDCDGSSLPTFTPTAPDLERVKQAALDTEVSKLAGLLGDKWLVTRGTLGWQGDR